MVKNTTGGNKTKGKARKHLTAKPSNILRLSHNKLEQYAQVTKTLGNGMCHVICIDNNTRLCHIRGKFRGRGKRDNFIKTGCWILVGLREWEESGDSTESSTALKSKKLNNCDLLEVYNDQQKEQLKNNVSDVNWRTFIINDNKFNNTYINDEQDDGFEFIDEKEEEYINLINGAESNNDRINKTSINFVEEEEVDIDDI